MIYFVRDNNNIPDGQNFAEFAVGIDAEDFDLAAVKYVENLIDEGDGWPSEDGSITLYVQPSDSATIYQVEVKYADARSWDVEVDDWHVVKLDPLDTVKAHQDVN